MGMAVGQAGANFHFHPEAAARFASTSEEQRQEQTGCQPCTQLLKGEIWCRRRKGKMKVGEANKRQKDKNLLELV